MFTFSLDAITGEGGTKSRAFDPDGVLGVSVAYIKLHPARTISKTVLIQ